MFVCDATIHMSIWSVLHRRLGVVCLFHFVSRNAIRYKEIESLFATYCLRLVLLNILCHIIVNMFSCVRGGFCPVEGGGAGDSRWFTEELSAAGCFADSSGGLDAVQNRMFRWTACLRNKTNLALGATNGWVSAEEAKMNHLWSREPVGCDDRASVCVL